MTRLSALAINCCLIFLLTIPMSMTGQKDVKFNFNLGYNFYPESYFLPSEKILIDLGHTHVDAIYELNQAITPNLGFAVQLPLEKNQSLTIGVNYSIQKLIYHIEDKAPHFYNPYGNLEIQNNAFQFTANYQYKFNTDRRRKKYFSAGGGLFTRINSQVDNIERDAIDNILDDFPLGLDHMNKVNFGIRASTKMGIKYAGHGRNVQYMHFSLHGDLNFNGLYNSKVFFTPGVSVGIDLN